MYGRFQSHYRRRGFSSRFDCGCYFHCPPSIFSRKKMIDILEKLLEELKFEMNDIESRIQELKTGGRGT